MVSSPGGGVDEGEPLFVGIEVEHRGQRLGLVRREVDGVLHDGRAKNEGEQSTRQPLDFGLGVRPTFTPRHESPLSARAGVNAAKSAAALPRTLPKISN
jgi:hypothetical protein